MAWTESTPAEDTWSLTVAGSVWDNGASNWDIEGNLATTHWDQSAENTWSEA